MKRKLFFTLVFALVILIVSPLITAYSGPNPEKQIVWRYNGTMPIGHSVNKASAKWAQLVNERSGGRVKVQFYPAAQLYAAKDLSTAIPGRAVDMSECTPDTLAGIVPSTGLLQIPFIFESVQKLKATLEQGWDVMDNELKEHNMKLIFFIDGGGFSGPLTRNKAVRTVEDWKGLKIRAPGAIASRIVKSFGASSVSMSGGEVYTALQRGTVDGAVGGYASMEQRKWYEVCKYFPEYIICYSWFPQVANLNAWNELPKDIQKIMLDAGKEVAEGQTALATKEIENTKTKLRAAGLEGISLSSDELARWREISKGIWNDWANQSPACAKLLEIAKPK